MTNREKLTKTNIYDMLCKMHYNYFGNMDCNCILECANGGEIECKDRDCKICIEQWLNEEAE